MGGRTVCTLYLDVLLTECARDSVVDSVVAPSETRSSEMHRDRRVRGDSGTGSRFRGRAERETGTGRPRRARSAPSRVDREARHTKARSRERGLTQCATIDDYAPKSQFPRILPFPAVRARAARGRAAARGRRRRSVHGFTMSLSSNFTPITPRFACLGLCPRHMRCGVPLPARMPVAARAPPRRVVTLILTYLLSNLLTSLTLNT